MYSQVAFHFLHTNPEFEPHLRNENIRTETIELNFPLRNNADSFLMYIIKDLKKRLHLTYRHSKSPLTIVLLTKRDVRESKIIGHHCDDSGKSMKIQEGLDQRDTGIFVRC